MPRRILSPLFALLLTANTAGPPDLRVSAVTDGATLLLEDGRSLRLAGIEPAAPPMGAEPGQGWPLAEAAAKALADLALGQRLTVRGEARTDRHGRLLAQVVRGDGLWLQGELLARGLARVHTRPDARALAREMLAAEAGARAAERGIWRTRAYAVRPADPEALLRDRDSFQIVEGQVLRVTKAGGDAYLDFGEDWRTDVTVHIGRSALREFVAAGIDPLSYEGRTVRVRGWVGLRAGPLIEATHPEQIERLDSGGPSARPVPRPSRPPPDLSDPNLSDGKEE
ncbi:thermonuclease family protein [Roseomonas genomospecies 6]|uniref:Thermonuclease family protein n=1 Tax=Roseomonas genomospecies 6 TaxID=214106 RepID=A0A9W7NMJ7_9PROT|nr:thermonuclease family protein [Roseomonas genomospecies 6]KAA0683003.1 thermonuclease family protein [Roseomonas genomospecies 6]